MSTNRCDFNILCDTGEELYGAIYSPEKFEKGVKVPTIVYVYGGPCVQVICKTEYCDLI